MNPEESKKVLNEIIRQRNLPYSIELIDVQGEKYTVLNDFGDTTVYVKKGGQYLLQK